MALFIQSKDMEWHSPVEGVKRKVVAGEGIMMALYELKAGSKFPAHQHPEEQMAYIIKGKVEFTIGNNEEKVIFEEGMFFVFPPNEKHGANILEDSTVIDFFSSPMESYLGEATRPDYLKR